MSEPHDEQWLLKHRDKIEPLMLAIYDHLGPERLGQHELSWNLMRHKDGHEFMVARFHEMDYWLDAPTGDLRWADAVTHEKALEEFRRMLNDWAVRAEYDLDLDRVEEFRKALLLVMQDEDESHREWAREALRLLDERGFPDS